MSNLKTKRNFSGQLKLKYNRSRTWGFTVSIVDSWTDQKLAYAGGCGYSKIAGALTDFIFMNFEDNDYLKLLRSRIDSGYLCGWNESSIEDLEKFFLHLGYRASIKKYDKSKYPIYRIDIAHASDEEFEELQETFIRNNMR